jgi:hypothetical protein
LKRRLPLGSPPPLATPKVIGKDPEKDVAVLQLQGAPRAKAALLRPVSLGSSSDLLVGQKVRGREGERWGREGVGGGGRGREGAGGGGRGREGVGGGGRGGVGDG